MESEQGWYKSALEEYNNRTTAGSILSKFLQDKADVFKFHSSKRILSIGPGTGDIDVPLLESSFPQLTHYIGIEPHQAEADVLKKRIYEDVNNANLKLTIIKDLVESWSGPDEPLDIILMLEVLYHIPDPKKLFTRCRQWLSPGGVMIIAHGGEDIFFHVGQQFDVKDEKYVAEHIQRDLTQLGFKQVEDDTVSIQLDIRDRNTDIMNFLLQKQASDKELAALNTYLTEVLPSGIDEQKLWVIWWMKP